LAAFVTVRNFTRDKKSGFGATPQRTWRMTTTRDVEEQTELEEASSATLEATVVSEVEPVCVKQISWV